MACRSSLDQTAELQAIQELEKQALQPALAYPVEPVCERCHDLQIKLDQSAAENQRLQTSMAGVRQELAQIREQQGAAVAARVGVILQGPSSWR